MPLNIYYNGGDYTKQNDDWIDIIFKDMDTGRKFVKTIVNPDIEIWVVKPEYRDFNYIKNFMMKKYCTPIKMKYKTRFLTLSKILNMKPKDVKYSPYIFQADMKIEHFYLMQFIMEYGNDRSKKLSMGFLDTENDIFQVTGFPEPGEAPMNCVTYIDKERMQSYTLVLKKDNIPYTNEDHPKHKIYEDIRASFHKQVDEFEAHTVDFQKELHENFDDSYGVFNYNILLFDDELNMFKVLFKIIKASDNDFIFIWNSPYDMSSMIERIKVLGGDPDEIIADARFKTLGGSRHVMFKEDTNALVHKRKHLCNTYTMPTFVDQMVVYAGVRSARGKIACLKLNAIAQKELKDTKLDYSEEGDIRMLPYMNFRKFVLYNFKDVGLQVGIDDKTRDSSTMYMSIIANAVLPNEIFTSTKILENSVKMFVFNLRGGYVVGSNKNKLYPNSYLNYKALLDDANDVSNEDVDPDNDVDPDTYDISENPDDSVDGEKKEEKFQGAFVMNPPHMSPSGFKLFNKPAKYIHDNVIDEDITSGDLDVCVVTYICNLFNCGNFLLSLIY